MKYISILKKIKIKNYKNKPILTIIMKRVRLIIKGRVQGVFFRHNTNKVAYKLGLKGFVRNLDDGSVEVIAEGDKKKIDELIQFCRKGPAYARVDDVKIGYEKTKGEFSGFEVR